MIFTGLLHESITKVQQINFQKVEIIVIYFPCNQSVTKEHDDRNAIQSVLHRQNENTQQFALLCGIASSRQASTSKQVREALDVLATLLGKQYYQAAWLLNMPQVSLWWTVQ